jgi:hypothetical protein
VDVTIQFNSDGLLPPRDFSLTLAELRHSILVSGSPSVSAAWDREWRSHLVGNLGILAVQLWKVGITEIFVDGSFVEDKDHPNDIDGYFVCDRAFLVSGDLHRELNALDPHKVWTWDPGSRTSAPGSVKRQLPMWHRYQVELYPHFGQGSGIIDSHGHELEFPSAFRQTRGAGKPKGIVKLIQEISNDPD